mgnify:CR=1 FL=1
MSPQRNTELRHLVGAAIALGAESIPAVSKAEADLARAVEPIPPDRATLGELREAIEVGLDPLGEEFCRIYSSEERRASGATFTPEKIINAMVGWATGGPLIDRIIDPGSGSARFATAAGRAMPKATGRAGERDPRAALLSRANLGTRGMQKRAVVEVGD